MGLSFLTNPQWEWYKNVQMDIWYTYELHPWASAPIHMRWNLCCSSTIYGIKWTENVIVRSNDVSKVVIHCFYGYFLIIICLHVCKYVLHIFLRSLISTILLDIMQITDLNSRTFLLCISFYSPSTCHFQYFLKQIFER